MISISHWGMFDPPIPSSPFFVPVGFKIAGDAHKDLVERGMVVGLERLPEGDPQPVYILPAHLRS